MNQVDMKGLLRWPTSTIGPLIPKSQSHRLQPLAIPWQHFCCLRRSVGVARPSLPEGAPANLAKAAVRHLKSGRPVNGEKAAERPFRFHGSEGRSRPSPRIGFSLQFCRMDPRRRRPGGPGSRACDDPPRREGPRRRRRGGQPPGKGRSHWPSTAGPRAWPIHRSR
jgi:hypothetical protein